MKMCKACGKEEGTHKLKDGYVCNRCYNRLPNELKGKKIRIPKAPFRERVSTKVFQDIEKPETDKWLRYKDKLSMCSDKIAMGGYEIHIKNIKRLSLVFHPEKAVRERIVYGSLCLNIETRYAKFEEEIEKCEILYRIDGKEISYTYPEVLSRLVKDINISIKEKTYNIAKTILWIRKEQMNLKGKAEYEYKKREESKEAEKVKEKIKWQETEHIREERKKEEERRREREKRNYYQGWSNSQSSGNSYNNNNSYNSKSDSSSYWNTDSANSTGSTNSTRNGYQKRNGSGSWEGNGTGANGDANGNANHNTNSNANSNTNNGGANSNTNNKTNSNTNSNTNNGNTNSNTNNGYQRSNSNNNNNSNSNNNSNDNRYQNSNSNSSSNSNNNSRNNNGNSNTNSNRNKNNSDFINTKVNYEVAIRMFGIGSYYTAKELKHRRNELIKQYHPDAGGSTKMCARINEAYEILEKRVS